MASTARALVVLDVQICLLVIRLLALSTKKVMGDSRIGNAATCLVIEF
jgi:hypothetical protein